MKLRSLAGIVSLFAVAFVIGASMVLMMSGTASACDDSRCYRCFISCPADSPCPGVRCEQARCGQQQWPPTLCTGAIMGWTCGSCPSIEM